MKKIPMSTLLIFKSLRVDYMKLESNTHARFLVTIIKIIISLECENISHSNISSLYLSRAFENPTHLCLRCSKKLLSPFDKTYRISTKQLIPEQQQLHEHKQRFPLTTRYESQRRYLSPNKRRLTDFLGVIERFRMNPE